jgi:5-methylcytosine-specific restriction endonuclease McrA
MADTNAYYFSGAWRRIREACLKRDGYRCRLCNSQMTSRLIIARMSGLAGKT